MKVSIVVLNYNYGRFVAQAIDSALRQTWSDREVIVVDNGSTDDSVGVIEAYGDRIRMVRQPNNIGQGHGYNLGFAAAQGEWIIWLDADDTLDANAIERCMLAVQPDTSKVHFPLRLIDGDSKPLSGQVPFVLHEGDVSSIVRRFGHYAGPPGSGNLYRRAAVAPCFPVPVGQWPIGTDTVPFVAAAFAGRVVSIATPLGCYRLHSKAAGNAPGYVGNYRLSVDEEVAIINRYRDNVLSLLKERTGVQCDGPFLPQPTFVRRRIVSWRHTRSLHPFPEDTAASLLRLMAESVRLFPGYSVTQRILMRVWACGVLYGPAALSNALIASNVSGVLRKMLLWSPQRRVT